MAVKQAQLPEHVLRSVRGWLHQLYPTLNIFVDESARSPEALARPAFRLKLAAGPDLKAGSQGVSFWNMSVVITYAAESQWDAHRVVSDVLTSALPPAGRIPLSLYNFPWPALPAVDVAASTGGTLPEQLDVALVAEDADGNRSAPAERTRLVVPAGYTIQVTPQERWPTRSLVDTWHLYAAPAEGTLRLQGSWGYGTTPPVLAAVDPDGTSPPTQARIPYSGLRCHASDGSVMESPEDSLWDAHVTLRLVCDLPRILLDAQIDPLLVA